MKLRRLTLTAFGPFTNEVLDLGDGLTIVHGNNEAGKSSSLRALHDFLYGIPLRTDDNFVHENKALEISGVLETADGQPLELRRRKARKNDLVDVATGKAVAQERLETLMGSVGEGAFNSLFGINHHGLDQGAEDILRSGGAVGPSLYSASRGVGNLREVQQRLDAEAEALFKARGSKPAINAAVARFKDQHKAAADAATPAARYDDLSRELADLETRRTDLQHKLDDQTREQARLERLSKACAPAMRRKELQDDLVPLTDAPVLPEDFNERRTTALLGLEAAHREAAQAREALEAMTQARQGLSVNAALVEAEDLVVRLYREANTHAKARRDAENLRREAGLHRDKAQSILAQLRPDISLEQVETLRLPRTAQARITQLGTQFEVLSVEAKRAQSESQNLTRELEAARAALAELAAGGDTSALKAILERVQTSGNPELRLAELEAEREAGQEQAAADLARLGRWSGPLQEVEPLAVPVDATIQRFDANLREAEAVLRSQREARAQAQARLAAAGEELQHHLGATDAPGPDDLVAARKVRDEGWRLVRRTLDGKKPVNMELQMFVQSAPSGTDLAGAFESSQLHADTLADALVHDADAVARRAELERNLTRAKAEQDSVADACSRAQSDLEALQGEWAEQWKPLGIDPLPPAEMTTWLAGWKDLRRRLAQMREGEAAFKRLQDEAQALKLALTEALQALGDPAPARDDLTSLLTLAGAAATRHDEARRAAQALRDSVADLERRLGAAQASDVAAQDALGAWTSQWTEALEPLGMPAQTLPAEARAMLDELGLLFEALAQAQDKTQRIEAIEANARTYHQEISQAVGRLAPDLDAAEPARAVDELYVRLTASKEHARELARLDEEGARRTSALEAAQVHEADHAQALKQLCTDAGCETPDALPRAEERSRLRVKLETELDKTEAVLSELAAGQALDEFCTLALGIDPDEARARVRHLGDEITTLTGQRDELSQRIGALGQELRAMDGSSRAAQLTQQASETAAELQDHVDRYVRLHLAARVLTREVEQYRRRHQGPVLERAADIFAALTGGSFSGVLADYDEQGDPVLKGQRPEGQLLEVTAMSDGTRDQLYLALRLAGLHNYLDHNVPMPFVVDDILVNFDDQRSKATLAALAELARRTQVVFFTHHRHLVDLATDAAPADLLTIVSL